MKVALCVLSYKRYDLTAKTVAHNIANCHHENIGLFVEDTFGVAKAHNNVLRRAMMEGYEGFVIMGNDILMPTGWLKAYVEAWSLEAGMISFPVDPPMRNEKSFEQVIGNFFIGRNVVNTIGAFNEKFDPYGAIDLDYNRRCEAAGLRCFYLPNNLQYHIGGQHAHGNIYGFDKQEMVSKTWGLLYAPIENIPLIDMVQFEGEEEPTQ